MSVTLLSKGWVHIDIYVCDLINQSSMSSAFQATEVIDPEVLEIQGPGFWIGERRCPAIVTATAAAPREPPDSSSLDSGSVTFLFSVFVDGTVRKSSFSLAKTVHSRAFGDRESQQTIGVGHAQIIVHSLFFALPNQEFATVQ